MTPVADFTTVLRDRFGLNLKDPGLLTLALTHSSKHRQTNNERLEFLGDRVLALVLADTLYHRYPHENEGAQALRHAGLVRAESLARIGRDLRLHDYLHVSNHDRASGTAQIDNVLADTLEALIGALYLDCGFEACRKVVENLWQSAIDEMVQPPQDPKTTLQEFAQGRGLDLPKYDITARNGPDHAPTFTIRVSIDGLGTATATGASRRLAEKAAATHLLQQLNTKEKS